MSDVLQKTYTEARFLALAYYSQVRDKLPIPQREMPRYIHSMKAYSVNDVVAAIQSNTAVGQELVFDYAKSQNWVIVGAI